MFPLDDNFVFGDIFFLWLIFFFGRRPKKKYSANKKKILTNKRSYSSNGNTYMPMIYRFYAPPPFIFLPPLPLSPLFITFIPTTNENTLSTETRICLRNAVLLPPYSLCYFIKWGDKHNFSPLHDLLSSTKKHFFYAL